MTTLTAVRGTMPLSGHLREARGRALRAAAAVAIGIIAGYVLSDGILEILRAPIEQLALERNASLNYDSVTGAFELKLKISLFAGIVLASPVWLFELFRFLAPGLTRREKRYTFGFVFSALPLFAAGCATGFLLFPHMVELLTSFAADQDSTILTASYYVDFVMKVIVATGIAFVLPVFVVLLNAMGVLPAVTIRRSWRVVLIAIVVFSALVTPAADVLSMFLVALPMTVLFAAAFGIAHVHDRRAARRAAADLLPAPTP